MKATHTLTLKEREDALKKLTKFRDDAVVSMLFGARSAYHNLNAWSYSIFKELGITTDKSDFKFSDEAGHAIYEFENKFGLDQYGKCWKCGSLQHSCIQLASYFLLLADMMNIVIKASKSTE